MVVLSEPLLKRALTRREKHELLFAAAILALGRDKSLKQQTVSFSSMCIPGWAAEGPELQDVVVCAIDMCLPCRTEVE